MEAPNASEPGVRRVLSVPSEPGQIGGFGNGGLRSSRGGDRQAPGGDRFADAGGKSATQLLEDRGTIGPELSLRSSPAQASAMTSGCAAMSPSTRTRRTSRSEVSAGSQARWPDPAQPPFCRLSPWCSSPPETGQIFKIQERIPVYWQDCPARGERRNGDFLPRPTFPSRPDRALKFEVQDRPGNESRVMVVLLPLD